MLDKWKKALVLFIIGLVSGVSIYGVNLLTADTIDENVLNREKGFYKEIFELDESVEITFTEVEIEEDFYEIEIRLADDTIVGYVYKGKDNNNYGNITILVGIENGEIKNVIISESSNTPNFVNKIKEDYLSPFMGQSVSNVSFDSRTGASFTYGSVEKVVQASSEYYNTERGTE